MSDTKKQTDLKPVVTNEKDNQKAGYGGRKTQIDKKDRELDEPNDAPNYEDENPSKKKVKEKNPKDRELDEETETDANSTH